MSAYREPSDFEAKRSDDQVIADASVPDHFAALFENAFTPINRLPILSTVSIPHEVGTVVAEGSRRKRARTTSANKLVADYLGIGVDTVNRKAPNHFLAATSKPKKRKRASKAIPSLAESATNTMRITDGMPIVKKPRQFEDHLTFSTNMKIDQDVSADFDSLAPELRKTIIAPSTSIDSIRTTLHTGFTSYDSRPVSSSSLDSMHQGHRVRRVISRKRSTSRNDAGDAAIDDIAFMAHDAFDLDEHPFEQPLDEHFSDPAELPKQALLNESPTETTDYTTDFDSDDLIAMYHLADSGYMSSPRKGGTLVDQGHSLTSSTIGPTEHSADCLGDVVYTPAAEQDIWSISDGDMDDALIDLVQRVESNAQEGRSTSRNIDKELKATTPPSAGLDEQQHLNADFTRTQTASLLSSSLSAQRLLDSTSVSAAHDSATKQQLTVRKPFPQQIEDRSPVLGVSTNSILRTCFRVSEALDTGCHAVRNGKNVVIELYARVVSSSREQGTVKQHFVFADLSYNDPPYLEGTYEVWSTAKKWNEDSARFLNATEEGSQVCRCVGSMKRDKAKWKMLIHSIQEASWEDVEYTAGIYRDTGR